MKSIFKDIFKILKKLIFFKNLIFYSLNIFENNFYMVKSELPAGNDIIFYLYVT